MVNLTFTRNLGFIFILFIFCAQIPALASDQPLAKVGADTITANDLRDIANAVPEKFKSLYFTPEGRQKTLEYIVNIYLLSNEAEKQGLNKKPEIAKLLEFTKRDILARKYLDQMTKDLPAPTEEEAKAFYEKNKAQFVTPESVHLHHILLKTEKEAKEALGRLKKGEKFADLATQISICPSKAKGGDLDWLPKGSLVKEVEDVAFTMKPGQPVGPVQSKFGYHILLLEDKKTAQQPNFEQVKSYIIEQLKLQKQQDQYEKISENLRKTNNVQIMVPKADVPSAEQPK